MMHTVETLRIRIAGRLRPLPPGDPDESIREPVLPIYCYDGFYLSVQAGQFLYSTPRIDHAPFTAVEVGFPSAPVPMLEAYKDTPSRRDEDAVFCYVPIELVVDLINQHGGEVSLIDVAQAVEL